MVILYGDHMAIAQSCVEVESNIESEPAPILSQAAEERTARGLDRVPLAENATIRIVQVSFC